MPKIWIPTLLLALALASSAQSQLFSRRSARVLTDAWASPEFVERRETPDGPARMTYHFYQGNFHGGSVADGSLKRVTLQDIAETLANDMAEQNFYPAESTLEGDLLIVLHWGVTEVEIELDELFPDSGESGESTVDEDGFETEAGDTASDLSTLRRSSVAENARLTGIQKALSKKGLLPSEREEIRSLLDEERYFIILMAYDWQILQKEKRNELLWSCRFSLPAIGTNFEDAVPSLSRAAMRHIGTNLDDLAKTKTHLGWGKTKVGELEVIESLSDDEVRNEKK